MNFSTTLRIALYSEETFGLRNISRFPPNKYSPGILRSIQYVCFVCAFEKMSKTESDMYNKLVIEAYGGKNDDIINENLDIRIENIFLENYQDIPQSYKDFIQNDGITIVLCDGGDKIREFNLLSKFIKSGDFILGHDYAVDRKTFDDLIDRKVWNWYELSESDILDGMARSLVHG